MKFRLHASVIANSNVTEAPAWRDQQFGRPTCVRGSSQKVRQYLPIDCHYRFLHVVHHSLCRLIIKSWRSASGALKTPTSIKTTCAHCGRGDFVKLGHREHAQMRTTWCRKMS